MGDKSPKKEQKEKEKTLPRSGKGFTFEVVLLDGEHVNIELDKNAAGNDLFEKVCQHLDLQEKEYFGLQYVDERIPSPLKCWLSPDKKISKQKKRGPWLFDFALKFYPPDPTQLRESLTRWLVTLQTRRDILNGKLPATFMTQAMLGSYCVQADIGDYDPSEHQGIDYVRDIPFTPNQTKELLEKIVELHRQHKGQTPDEAEINYLENVKKLSMYGVDLHAAQDVNNIDIMIGVCASGLQVYRDKLRISRFVWPKILKISYKRNHFYVKIRPHDNSRMENSVSFKLASHRLAKRLWKICVEHHAFFRLREAEQPHNAAMFPRLGSKFRYSGRTLYQARHSSQNLDRPDPYFERREPARNTYVAPTSRSRSVDDVPGHPDYWKDDLDAPAKRRSTEGRGEGRDKRDHIGQPTVLSMLGLPEGMKPVENEQGREVEPGTLRSRDGRDRHDLKPGEEDTTLERADSPGTMGLTPAELQKKAKEDEKERKKREREEEKKRKKEEEERKKAEKKGKGKGSTDPTAEDRTDLMGGGDTTEKLPGRTSGIYADREGEPIRLGVVAPVGSATGDKVPGRRGYPDSADADRKKGAATYPGIKPEYIAPVGSVTGGPRYAPGMGVGSGDMSGVVGEETFIDNKMSFLPAVPHKKESRESLKNPHLSGIDHTMPFFSPAATSTVGRPRSGKVPPPISPKPNNTSFDDSFSRRDPPTVATESVQYHPDLEEVPVPTKNVPLVKTETRTVTYEREGFPFDSEDGVLVSARSHSTRMQTIDTTTYKMEKDGIQETRVEHRVVLSSTDDDFDYDAALAEAIRSVTEFNPDMSVERIECVQQIEEVKDY